jgi:hypothetical protein
MPNQSTETPPPYDRAAIFHRNSPIDPLCVAEAVAAIKRATPIDPAEPRDLVSRRMHCALRSLSALHARDEIELMLGVQALCAYYAACACWRLGMNLVLPHGDSTRHIATATSAARTFDSMLRALERRQAKPLSVPVGRPEPQEWVPAGTETADEQYQNLLSIDAEAPIRPQPPRPPFDPDQATDDEILDASEFHDGDEGLDLENTKGILPDGGMIVPDDPTPQQGAYMNRRLLRMYRREREVNRRAGIMTKTVIRPIRTGDLIR